MKKIYIGFNYKLTNHNYSIAVIMNGELRAIELERINRLKKSPNELFQRNKYFFSNGDISKKYIKIEKIFVYLLDYFFLDYKFSKDTIIYIVNSPLKLKYFNSKELTVLYTNVYKHHYLHAYSAYAPSLFNTSTILCIDGSGYESNLGQHICQSIREGEGNNIKYIESTIINIKKLGIGHVYSLLSNIIGLDKGSVMGLSAYGNSHRYDNIKLFIYNNNEIILNPIFFKGIKIKKIKGDIYENPILPELIKNIKAIFKIKEIYKKDNIINTDLADLAAKLQKETEDAIIYLARRAYNLTKNKNLCLAGGVALNVLANTKILEKTQFKNIFIQPAAEDSGLSIGAVYYAYHILGGEKYRIQLEKAGLGKKYSENEIKLCLRDCKNDIYIIKKGDIINYVSKKLAEGFIFGWFNLGSEFGPRALGFRSILASPINKKMKDKVNSIKNREKWRPLAPVVLEEDIYSYFEKNRISGYMTLVGKVKSNKKRLVPSITHIDGTARYQSVNKNQNYRLYKLICAFKDRTGEGILLNTSFNNKGEPIVESPKDALNMFLSTDIDYLVLNDFIIKKRRKNYKYEFFYEDMYRIFLNNILFSNEEMKIYLEKSIRKNKKNIFKEKDELNIIKKEIKNKELQKNKIDKYNRLILKLFIIKDIKITKTSFDNNLIAITFSNNITIVISNDNIKYNYCYNGIGYYYKGHNSFMSENFRKSLKRIIIKYFNYISFILKDLN